MPGVLDTVRSMINLSSIEEIILPECSQVLIVLKVKSSRDMIIECFRRFELVRFLQQVAEKEKSKRFKVTMSSKYKKLTQFQSEYRRRQDRGL